jgi:hypothetical protein
MSLSKGKFWYSDNCLHFSKRTVPLMLLYLCLNFHTFSVMPSTIIDNIKKRYSIAVVLARLFVQISRNRRSFMILARRHY